MRVYNDDDSCLDVPGIFFICCLVGVLVFLFLSTHLSPDIVERTEKSVQSVFSKKISTEVYFYGYHPPVEKER